MKISNENSKIKTVHWLIPGKYNEYDKLSKSMMASIRMRAGLVARNKNIINIEMSAGDEIELASTTIIIGKIGADCELGRSKYWLDQLTRAKQEGKRIVLDYTDHHLAHKTSPMRPFYAQALSLVDEAVVPSDLMKSHLKEYFDAPIHVIADPIEIPITPPYLRASDNSVRTLLWFGHATNIKYLMNYLSDHTLCDANFNLIILSNDVGLKTFVTTPLTSKGQIHVDLKLWSIKEMCTAAQYSDVCIIPSDSSDPVKSGASSNRLLTSLALGLPTLAENLDSYNPFNAFYSDIRQERLTDFLNGLAKEINKVGAAQREVLPNYTQDALLKQWAFLLQ